MKPKIDDVVYVIVEDQIHKYSVGYLGKQSFVVDGYEWYIHSQFEYDCYNITWFKNLEKAKIRLRKEYGRKKIIEIVRGETWGIEEDE